MMVGVKQLRKCPVLVRFLCVCPEDPKMQAITDPDRVL